MAGRRFAPLLAACIAFARDRRAVTVIEYAFIASLAAISIVAGATGIGLKLSAIFNQISPEL